MLRSAFVALAFCCNVTRSGWPGLFFLINWHIHLNSYILMLSQSLVFFHSLSCLVLHKTKSYILYFTCLFLSCLFIAFIVFPPSSLFHFHQPSNAFSGHLCHTQALLWCVNIVLVLCLFGSKGLHVQKYESHSIRVKMSMRTGIEVHFHFNILFPAAI